MIRNPRFHGGSNSQASVNAAETVIGKMEGNRVFQVVEFFFPRIFEALALHTKPAERSPAAFFVRPNPQFAAL